MCSSDLFPSHDISQLETIQLCWVASEDLIRLGADARSIYEWVDTLGRRALVPADFWQEVMGSD